MAEIGLVIRPDITKAKALGLELLAWASDHGHNVLLENVTAEILEQNSKAALSCQELALQANPIVCLGGDGTLIGVARYVSKPAPTMIGVNFGKLGFLTEILPKELFDVLPTVLDEQATVAERSMLKAEVLRKSEAVFSSAAVNDAVVQKGSRDPLLEMDLVIECEEIMRLRGDGMIISTPTGSTAYSLAAGGSIVHPDMSALLVTPICSHSLTCRPLILDGDYCISVKIPAYEGEVFLSMDGQEAFTLSPGDQIKLCRAENTVRFVRSPNKSYFDILRTKLNWGLANASD